MVFHAVTKENVLFLILVLPAQQLNAFAEAENRETKTGKSGEMTIVLVTFTYSQSKLLGLQSLVC